MEGKLAQFAHNPPMRASKKGFTSANTTRRTSGGAEKGARCCVARAPQRAGGSSIRLARRILSLNAAPLLERDGRLLNGGQRGFGCFCGRQRGFGCFCGRLQRGLCRLDLVAKRVVVLGSRWWRLSSHGGGLLWALENRSRRRFQGFRVPRGCRRRGGARRPSHKGIFPQNSQLAVARFEGKILPYLRAELVKLTLLF